MGRLGSFISVSIFLISLVFFLICVCLWGLLEGRGLEDQDEG